MDIVNLVLMIVLIVCMIVLLIQIRANQSKNVEYQEVLLKKSQESILKNEWMNTQRKDQWDTVLEQVQTLQKEQYMSMRSMQNIENDIYAMNQIMTNTKLRGNWGEYQLDLLLSQYASENRKVYEMQFTLNNGKIADCVFHLPDTDKILCIDSKFPMENYSRILEYPDNVEYEKAFRKNVKKHIDDISKKYITAQTMNQAILFIPSEAIYQFVCAKCEDLVSYALKKHVFITSPTTLVGITFTLISSTKDFYRASHLEEIEQSLLLLQEDVERLVERSEKAEKSLESLAQQFHNVSTSSKKIKNRIDKITGGEA